MSPRRARAKPATPETRRRRLRRRLLLWTAPLWLAAVGYGWRLVGVPGTVAVARSAYDDGQFGVAATDYTALQHFPPVETWKAHFDAGTAEVRNEDVWGAYDDLKAALTMAPEDAACMVQTNLAIATEAAGDDAVDYAADDLAEATDVRAALAAREAGEPYDEAVLDPDGTGVEPDPDDLEDSSRSSSDFAATLYADATELRGRTGCEQQSDAAASANADAQDRLDSKEQSAAAAAADPSDTPPPPTQAPSGSPEEQEAARRSALAERNAEAANGREQELQEQASGDGAGDGDGTGSSQRW